MKNLANNTLEDRLDDEVILGLKYKLEQGLPLGDDYHKIKDPTKYKEWKDISESPSGQGLGHTATADYKEIDGMVRVKLQMLDGVLDTKGPEYLTMLSNAKAYYAAKYREAFHVVPEDKKSIPAARAQWAMEQLRIKFTTDPQHFSIRPAIDVNIQESRNAKVAFQYLENSDHTAVTSGIIPGTESAYKILESQWVKNPYSRDTLPPIYRVLAVHMGKGKGYTGWHLARDQYKAVTGKDLPKPKQLTILERKPTLTQNLMTFKPSPRTVRQAAIEDKNGGNYNGDGMLTDGVTVPDKDSTAITEEVQQ